MAIRKAEILKKPVESIYTRRSQFQRRSSYETPEPIEFKDIIKTIREQSDLDNIALTEDESCFAEIKKALTIIGCPGLSDLFEQYLKAYRANDHNKMNGLDSKFWEQDEEFEEKYEEVKLCLR